MLLRAWQFSANVFGEDQDGMEDYLQRYNAFSEPLEGVYLKKIPMLLVTRQWSNPSSVEYGRDIRVYASTEKFSYKIYGANMGSVEAPIIEKAAPLIISKDNPYIRGIENPMISFKSNTDEPVRIDFETL